MSDALSNWQWLVPLPRRDDAVVLASSGAATALSVTEGFARTRSFDPCEPADAGAFEATWGAQCPDGSLDCVVLPDACAVLPCWSDPPRLVAAVRRALRPGAGWYVVAEAIRPDGAGRHRGLRRSRHLALVRAAGFPEVRTYYLVHSPEQPRHIVPIEPQALLAWDRTIDSGGVQGTLRRALIRAGLHGLLFRYRLILARA